MMTPEELVANLMMLGFRSNSFHDVKTYVASKGDLSVWVNSSRTVIKHNADGAQHNFRGDTMYSDAWSAILEITEEK